MIILTEQDIINTYDPRQQEQCRLYFEYKRIKNENSNFGYKRIAKLLGQPYGKTRWWHAGKHIPVPIQTVEWLKTRELLPLTLDHPKLPLLSRVLGASFGDGGIFANLNAIFLSSSELDAVKEFGDDLKTIFGDEIEKNFRIIESGEYGHSWCYQNTNRNIIRLFVALGAPVGRKSALALSVPSWIFLKQTLSHEFFGAYFGGELGTPTIHKNNNQLTSLDLGIVSNNKIFAEEFLEQVRYYLTNNSIKTGSICITPHDEFKFLFRLQISKDLENYNNFVKKIPMKYCLYKQKRLEDALVKFIHLKKERYKDLRRMDYTHEHTLKLLNLTEESFNLIKWN